MGITMVQGFVQASGPATIEDVLNHIDHVIQLTDGPLRRNYSRENIALILGGNFQRVLKTIWVPESLAGGEPGLLDGRLTCWFRSAAAARAQVPRLNLDLIFNPVFTRGRARRNRR